MSEQNITPSLMGDIGDSGLKDILSEGVEQVIDSFLTDGLVKNIPVIDTFRRFYSIGLSVSDYFLVRKLAKFLSPVNSISVEERKSFAMKLDSDKKFKQEIGEKLILLIGRIDDMKKPEMIGKLFKAHVINRINFDTFQRLAIAIDHVHLPDLSELKNYYNNLPANGMASQNLAAYGLLHTEVESRAGSSPIVYSISNLGKLLVEIIFLDETTHNSKHI